MIERRIKRGEPEEEVKDRWFEYDGEGSNDNKIQNTIDLDNRRR